MKFRVWYVEVNEVKTKLINATYYYPDTRNNLVFIDGSSVPVATFVAGRWIMAVRIDDKGDNHDAG